jgi:hypothetical protein
MLTLTLKKLLNTKDELEDLGSIMILPSKKELKLIHFNKLLMKMLSEELNLQPKCSTNIKKKKQPKKPPYKKLLEMLLLNMLLDGLIINNSKLKALLTTEEKKKELENGTNLETK